MVVLLCKVETRVYEIYQFCGCSVWEITYGLIHMWDEETHMRYLDMADRLMQSGLDIKTMRILFFDGVRLGRE